MKNNKGFTLIEMIVVIAIVGALSVTIGFSSNKVKDSTQVSKNKEILNEIFDAGIIYANLSVAPSGCTNPSTCESGCSISLSCLINKGLLDNNILDKKNPLTNNNFNSSDSVYVNKTGETSASVTYGSCTVSKSSLENSYNNIDNWGKC